MKLILTRWIHGTAWSEITLNQRVLDEVNERLEKHYRKAEDTSVAPEITMAQLEEIARHRGDNFDAEDEPMIADAYRVEQKLTFLPFGLFSTVWDILYDILCEEDYDIDMDTDETEVEVEE